MLIFCSSLFLLSFRDLTIRLDDHLYLYGGESGVFVKSQEYTLFYGDWSDEIHVLWRALSPYFSRSVSVKLQEMKTGGIIKEDNLYLSKLSENFIYGNIDGVRIFFVGAITEDEILILKKAQISFQTDLWVLNASFLPDFIPLVPTKGIIFIGNKPVKRIKDYAKIKTVPLLYYKNTGGFLLEKNEVNWSFFTR